MSKAARHKQVHTSVNQLLHVSPNQNTGELELNAPALLAELRQTCDRLFASLEKQGQTDKHLAPQGEGPGSPRLAGEFNSAGLKRMLQLRSRRRRKARVEFFEWPTWDMLLDLAAVRAEGGHVSVSSVCISSGAPQSTALRKLAALEGAKLVRRYFHGSDRRRVCIALTDEAAEIVETAIRDEVTFYQSVALVK
jgi:DNA-binding transcriptional ArsR family regulator